ncbi:SH3 domain-containing protein [Streptomyces antibioticus]
MLRIRRAATALTLTAALAGSGLVVAAGTAEAAAKGCYVTAKSANIRSKASTSSTSVGMAYKGNKCSEKDVVIKGSYFWFKVKMTSGNAKGKTGWIRDDLLHTSGDDVHTCIPEDTACHG